MHFLFTLFATFFTVLYSFEQCVFHNYAKPFLVHETTHHRKLWMNSGMNSGSHTDSLLVAWLRGPSRPFYDYTARGSCDTRTLVTLLCLWIRPFTMLSLLGGFEQAANSVDKNTKKFSGTLNYQKLIRTCEFLQSQTSYRNEKWSDRPIVSVWRCPVTEG